MKPIGDRVTIKPAGESTVIKAVTRDEEGHKRVEKVELPIHNIDTVKLVEKKLAEKGVQRMERHPSDGQPLARPPPKSGHGGKYTWEGPGDEVEYETDPVPAAIDEKDPNYVDEAAEEKVLEDVGGDVVVGKVEVAKAAEEGVARIEVDPQIKDQVV